jgi:hypothetical protein
MSQKVWVIDDQGLDNLPGMSQRVAQHPENGNKESASPPKTSQKNPASAFSLSMLVWGCGHMHIGQRRLGLMYLAAMVIFYTIMTAVAFCWDSVARLISENPELIISAMIIFLFGLLVWMFNAADAYYRTLRLRDKPFLGADKIFWPFAASLLFPGWGQFLNGQPRKGIFFLLFGVGGVFSVFTLFLARHVWHLLETSQDRYVFEICLLGVSLVVPIVLLMWVASAYDAFRSCEYYLRYRLRSKLVGKRLPGRGFLVDLVPQCSAVLGLMLAVSLGVQSIPKQYYVDSLKNVRVEMLSSNMTIIPEMVQKTIELISW